MGLLIGESFQIKIRLIYILIKIHIKQVFLIHHSKIINHKPSPLNIKYRFLLGKVVKS